MMPEFKEEWFPLLVQYIEHGNLIQEMTWAQYKENTRSFLVLVYSR